ncbi:NrdH-redoxin [Candidatus Microgenomates bacterium]|nr:NrdH-redoxin [Candidatus Microgenomates bacterium]
MESEYLSSKGIKFAEIYVDQDAKAAEEMVKISNQMGVPFTVITYDDGRKETILGFDRTRIDQALGLTSN